MNELLQLNILAMQGLGAGIKVLTKTTQFATANGKLAFEKLEKSIGFLLKSFGGLILALGLTGLILSKLINSVDLKTYNNARNLDTNASGIKTRQLALENSGINIDVTKIFGMIKEAMIDPGKRTPFVQAGITDINEKSDPKAIFDALIKKLGSGEVNKTLALRSLNEFGLDVKDAGMLLTKGFEGVYKTQLQQAERTHQLNSQQYATAQNFQVKMNLLGETFSNLMASIGTKLIPYLEKFADAFKNFIDTRFDEVLERVAKGLVGLADFLEKWFFTPEKSKEDQEAYSQMIEHKKKIDDNIKNFFSDSFNKLSSLGSNKTTTSNTIQQVQQVVEKASPVASSVNKVATGVVNKITNTTIYNSGVSDAKLKNNNSKQLNAAQ